MTDKTVLDLVEAEYYAAVNTHPRFNSYHEGWAVIKEELDELWEEVRKKKECRDKDKMREEAIQIAAMGIRFAKELC